MKQVRFWLVVSLLALTVLLLRIRDRSERQVAYEPLSQFPLSIGGWTGSDQIIDPASLNILGPGEFLSRIYTRGSQADPISLFIGYFPTQRTGATIHSPKNCLPGAGWAFESSRYLSLKESNGTAHRVGEYVITNGGARQLVIYWYQAHGRSLASEYAAKIYLVTDAIRMNRSDGALVRVITPIDGSDGLPAARARVEAFAINLLPTLARFIPN